MIKYFNLFIDYIKSDIGWWPFAFAVIMGSKVLGGNIPMSDIASYAMLIIASIICLRHGGDFDRLSTAFILFIPVALVLASPAPVFKSWSRYVLFAILYIAVSPLARNEYSRKFRLSVLKMTIIICIALSCISFVCYFLGVNMMRSNYDGSELNYMVNTAGTFGGITAHSMLLGPISGIATIACSYLAMNQDKRYWILAAMCAGSMLFAASRSSLLATLCGEMALFYFSTESIGKNTKRILTVGTILFFTYPVWNGAMAGVIAKNQGSMSSGINTSSRADKWSIRIEEWESSPIYGVGFCAVSEKDDVGSDGIIEPGSSWLAVLSMTGIMGFILFFSMFYRAVRNSLRHRTPYGALIGSVLILLGVHMFAEGHVFSGGSYLCLCVWLGIGCATDYEPDEIDGEE